MANMNVIDDIKGAVRRGVLVRQVPVLGESKDSIGDWWDRLPGKRRKKVCEYLGLSQNEKNKTFDRLADSARSEVEAYYHKHQGRVEWGLRVGEDVDPKESVLEAIGRGRGKYVQDKNWKKVEAAVGEYNSAVQKLDKALGMLALAEIGPNKGPYAADAIKQIRARMGKKIEW